MRVDVTNGDQRGAEVTPNQFVVVEVPGETGHLVTEPLEVTDRDVLQRFRQFLFEFRFVECQPDAEVCEGFVTFGTRDS